MFDTLNQVAPQYPFSSQHPPAGHTYFLQDSTYQSALFLFLEFIKTALSSGKPCTVLLFQLNYSSLSLLLRKQGINLDHALRSQQLTLYEVNEKSSNMISCEIPLTEQRPQGYLDRPPKVNTIKLNSQGVHQVMKEVSSKENAFVLLDNVYFMANLLDEPRLVLSLLLGMAASSSNFILGMTYDPQDQGQQLIFEKIEEKSQVVLRVVPLESGYAQEAQGQVQYQLRFLNEKQQGQFLFCLDEKGFRLFDSYAV